MPIPVTPLEEISAGTRLRLVPAALDARPFLYPRAIAHFFDYCVVQGASIYSAKLLSVIFVSFHSRAIAHSGRQAVPLLREAYDYSSTQLLAASFAALAVAYFVGMPVATGRTLGLGLLGLRIRSNDGSALTLRQLLVRMLGCLLGYASFGLLCVIGIRNREGRFLQDFLSGTRVTRE